MNSARIAAALNSLSLAFGELAEAINETPESERALATAPAAAPARVDSPSPASEPSPFEDEAVTWEPPEILSETVTLTSVSERDRVLAECPVHFTPWKVKEAGISRNGKPYPAFWKCNGKNADGTYCTKKPDAAWVKTHDPERALASA